MVSHDSLVRAEKRLGTAAVVGRFHRPNERSLADDYELNEKAVLRLLSMFEEGPGFKQCFCLYGFVLAGDFRLTRLAGGRSVRSGTCKQSRRAVLNK